MQSLQAESKISAHPYLVQASANILIEAKTGIINESLIVIFHRKSHFLINAYHCSHFTLISPSKNSAATPKQRPCQYLIPSIPS